MIMWPSYSNWSAAEVIEMPRVRSISSQSDTVPARPPLPCTAPARSMACAWSASASVRVDLPASGWEITAMLRLRDASRDTVALLSVEALTVHPPAPMRETGCAGRGQGAAVRQSILLPFGGCHRWPALLQSLFFHPTVASLHGLPADHGLNRAQPASPSRPRPPHVRRLQRDVLLLKRLGVFARTKQRDGFLAWWHGRRCRSRHHWLPRNVGGDLSGSRRVSGLRGFCGRLGRAVCRWRQNGGCRRRLVRPRGFGALLGAQERRPRNQRHLCSQRDRLGEDLVARVGT